MNNRAVFFRGIGVGFILAALVFFLSTRSVAVEGNKLSEQEIIEHARGLGMIFITEMKSELADEVDSELNEKNDGGKVVD